MPEDAVMAEPEEPDHGEADAETDEARLVDAEMTERGRVRAVKRGFLQPAGSRDFQVDGEQSDRDREDRVAEEEHAVVLDEPGAGEPEGRPVPATAWSVPLTTRWPSARVAAGCVASGTKQPVWIR